MRVSTFTTLAFGSLVAAHPFIIINTRVAAPTQLIRRDGEQSQNVLTTFASQSTGILRRQDKKTTKEEKDDKDEKDSKTTASVVVVLSSAARTTSVSASSTGVRLVPPVTQSFTNSATASGGDDDETFTTSTISRSASTVRSSSGSSTIRLTSTSSTPTSISLSSSSPTRSSTSAAGVSIAQSTATPTPNASSSTGLSPGGLACAIIFPIAILLIAAFLVFKFHPRSRAWWLARQERKRQQRSYRAGLDEPRTQALAATSTTTPSTPDHRRSMLQTFFTPSPIARPGTANTASTSTSIRRKPVNWGAQSGLGTANIPPIPEMPAELPASFPSEKTAMAAAAAPMGQLHSRSSVPSSPVSTSTHSSGAASGMAQIQFQNYPHLGFTPVSPRSPASTTSTPAGEKDLPRIPPSESRPTQIAELDSSPSLHNTNTATHRTANTAGNAPAEMETASSVPVPVTRAMRGRDGVFRLK